MEEQERKISVLIVDQQQEHKGILTNAALVIGMTAGRELSANTFGSNVVDGDGSAHMYLTRIAHFVRKAGQSKMRTLREAFLKSNNVLVVDYTEDAAPSNYETYSTTIKAHKGEEIHYRALYVYGAESIVSPLTKNLSRLE